MLHLEIGCTIYYASFFVMGIILACHHQKIMSFLQKLRHRWFLWISAVLVYNENWLVPNGKGFGIFHDSIHFSDAAIAIAAMGFIVLLTSGTLANRFMGRAIPQWLGKISYSMYLIHPIILMTVVHLTNEHYVHAWTVLLVPFLSLAFGHLYFTLVENPCLKAGRWMTRQKHPNDRLLNTALLTFFSSK